MPVTTPLPTSVTASPSLATGKVITDAPVAPDSAELVHHLLAQVAEFYGGTAAFNVTQYGAALYAVDPDVPSVPVTFRDEQRKGYLPAEFKAPGGVLALCPIPPQAQPAAGTDAQLGIVHGGGLTEYWRAQRDAAGNWSAVWGGRIADLATTTGQYPGNTGVSASGLMMPAYTLGIREVQAGVITHAVGIGITRVAAGEFSWPAVRTDGRSTAADAIHLGRIFRLRPEVDLDAIRWSPWSGARWGLSPIAKMIGQAAKTYGLVTVETSGGVSIPAESGAPVRAATGTDPWPVLMRNWPSYRVLGGFPWDQLEALPWDYGKPAPSAVNTTGGVR